MREKNSFSFWNILSLGDMELSGEDVGRTAEVRFTSFTGGGKWGINRTISFDVKIPKLFDTKYVELMDTLDNEDAEIYYEAFPKDCKAGKAWFVKNSNTQVKSEAVVFELSEQ